MGMKVVPEIYEQLPGNPVDMLLVCFDRQEDIAAFCSVSPQAVWNWKDRNSIPYWHAEDLSRYSGVPAWMLCPKHFKQPQEKGEMDVRDEFSDEGVGSDR